MLVEPSAQVREELAHAVAAEFGGSAAPLAEDALLHAPELVLERRFLPDSEGHAANGRETAPSEIFRLVTLDDGSCILVHLRNGHRKVLAGARCAAP